MRKTGITGLLKRWRSGDGQAFDRFVAMWEPWLRKQARTIAGKQIKRRVETDDLVQDTVARMVQYPIRYEIQDRHHWVATLLQQLRHAVVAERRAQKRLKAGGAVSIIPIAEDSDQDLLREAPLRPSEVFAQGEEQEFLEAAIRTLIEDDQVLVLLDLHGASLKEIGRVLGCRPNAARMRLKRALGRLGLAAEELRARMPPT
ncbi:MAG: RNA polymerase sigma factor [Planctomycetota bacterium]